MKILCIHAHFDDFEFVVSGTFELWRRKLGPDLQAKLVVCTDGMGGHHCRTREETGRIRLQEQLASAEIGGYEFELLKLPNGQAPREACLQSSPGLLAAMWKTIRGFEPDYLFCPPLPSDPLAGLHIDHAELAEAVRKVAYLINVPHCFTPEYPADETAPKPCKVPVILNVYDGYMSGANFHDLAVDVEPAFQKIAKMSYCHRSQLLEWLPWVGRHRIQPPKSLRDWTQMLRKRLIKRNAELGLKAQHVIEVFAVTAWGVVPTVEQLLRDFPNVLPEASNLDRLRDRLNRWNSI